MSHILLAGGDAPQFDPITLRGMYAFRHRIFYERLGWEVSSQNGLEFDEYDVLNPVYMVAKNDRREIEGCWRLLPTTVPYMLKDTFPQLLRGEEAPERHDVWELSRFAVAPSDQEDYRQANLGPVTRDMIRNVYDFAVHHGIRQYVTVTSVALERLLKKTGLPIRRFGDGKAQRVGKVLTVACWVDINEQFRQVAYPPLTSLPEQHAA